MLGYSGAEPRVQVERLMSDYFRHARIVSRSLGVGTPDGAGASGAESGPVARRDSLPRSDSGRPEPCDVGWRIRRCGECGRGSDRRSTLVHPAARRSLPGRRLLSAGARPRRCPELSAATCRVYSRGCLRCTIVACWGVYFRSSRPSRGGSCVTSITEYTVDEHTLLAIRNLERLGRTEEPRRQRFRELLTDCRAPELLALALLLHDVGKWRDDDYAGGERADGGGGARTAAVVVGAA